MKLDTAVQTFIERVDRNALQSIDEIASESGLRLTGATTNGFAMQEGFDTFTKYLNGYAQYKTKYRNDPKASSQEAIRTQTDKFLTETVSFEDHPIKYHELSGFIQGYINGIKALQETVNTLQTQLKEADVEGEAVGDIVEFADKFMGKLEGKFYPWLEGVLWESGYTAEQRLFGKKEATEPTPVFL